jgi:hypothetical protein
MLSVTLDTFVGGECDPEGCNKFDHNFTGFVFTVGSSVFTFGGEAREAEWRQIIKAFENNETAVLLPGRNIEPGKIDSFKESDNISLAVSSHGISLIANFTCHSFRYSQSVFVPRKEAEEGISFIKKYLNDNCQKPCNTI